MKPLFPLLALALGKVSSFLIIDAEPGIVIKAPGELVTLFCAVDEDYEYCKFISPDSKRICDFEWKRNEGNITMQQCDLDVSKKNVSFHGKYNDKECGMSFIAGEEDTGMWKCEIEEYVWGGSRGSGRKVWAQMNVTVMTPTTTSASSPQSTTTVTTTVTTTTTTTGSSTTAMIDAGGLTTSTTAKTAENKDVIPDAVPRTQGDGTETAGSMTSTIIAILAIIVITVCLGLAAAYYRRRQRQKRPDADAAVVYDAESRLNRDTANMVRTRGSVNLGTEDADNRNLHEFFPSSDSFA